MSWMIMFSIIVVLPMPVFPSMYICRRRSSVLMPKATSLLRKFVLANTFMPGLNIMVVSYYLLLFGNWQFSWRLGFYSLYFFNWWHFGFESWEVQDCRNFLCVEDGGMRAAKKPAQSHGMEKMELTVIETQLDDGFFPFREQPGFDFGPVI